MELSKRKKTTSNINNRKNDLLEDSVNSFDRSYEKAEFKKNGSK